MTITIIVLLAVVVAPEIANLNKSQSVQDNSQLVKQKLLEAQGMAQSPPVENNKAIAYGLKFSSEVAGGVLNQVRLQVRYPVASTCSDGSVAIICPIGINPAKLENSKIAGISPYVNTDTVWFTVGGQNKVKYSEAGDSTLKTPSDDIDDIAITIKNLLGTNDTRAITINKDSGVINVTE